jgi:hypothetical protein
MNKIIVISSLFCLLANVALAQTKKLQLSFHINPIDASLAGEFSLSENSTLHTAVGFGYGSVNSVSLGNYYDKSMHNRRNSDVALPQIFFAPYVNIQYRNYFSKIKDMEKGKSTDNNSGAYAGVRLKVYGSPEIPTNEQARSIRRNYMLGLIIGNQKAFGFEKRFLFITNAGIGTHANYNLSFFAFKPLLHVSIGYVIK